MLFKLNLGKFEDSAREFRILRRDSALEWSVLQKFTSKFPSFDNCGQDNSLGGQFWAMGRLNLLGGQSN